jgi:5-formyltetrahydrofolate cyclo-ligase
MPHGEVSTRNVVQDALSSGKQVFIPYIHTINMGPNSTVPIMDMLSLNSVLDFESLQPDKWGIPSLSTDTIFTRENCLGGRGISSQESCANSDERGLDLIVMPGMAFDSELKRLGHGKGYYDNFLNRYAKGILEHSTRSRRPFLGKRITSRQDPGR